MGCRFSERDCANDGETIRRDVAEMNGDARRDSCGDCARYDKETRIEMTEMCSRDPERYCGTKDEK